MADSKAVVKKGGLGKGRHLSQIKRQRQNEKKRLANQALRSTLRTAVRKLRTAIVAKDKTSAATLMKSTGSLLQKAAGRNLIHPSNASRQISRLSKAIHSL